MYSYFKKFNTVVKLPQNNHNNNLCNIYNEKDKDEKDEKHEKGPTFNILIATVGRKTLENLIDSLRNQLTKYDCISIVFDNNTIRDIKNINNLDCKVMIYNEKSKLGYWGHGIRNKYSKIIEKRDFIMHADDDDTYFEDVFDKLRKECSDKNIVYISKIIKENQIIPQNGKKIGLGNISTQCGIIPYEYNKYGTWAYFYGGDARFYMDLKSKTRMKIINVYTYNHGNTDKNIQHYKKLQLAGH
jgi:hypothetical protein